MFININKYLFLFYKIIFIYKTLIEDLLLYKKYY